METVKKLLESTKKDLEMKLWWAEEHDKEPQFVEEIPILKQKIADIDEALLRLFSVAWQSEQLKAFADWRDENEDWINYNCRNNDDVINAYKKSL